MDEVFDGGTIMTDRNLVAGFWAEGPDRLVEAMAERKERLEDLVGRLQMATSESERGELKLEIEELLAMYEPTDSELQQSLHLLF